MLASRGLRVTGIDFVASAIASAKEKAAQRGIAATFLVKDALQLGEWDERFDGAIDSGVFHVFSDEDRAKYVAGLRAVVRPGGRLLLLCFSDATPGDAGPRRVKREELERAFAAGWEIESIEATRLAIREEAKHIFNGEDPRAWLLTARRK
jgi:cyclopropane fatty-acyl-phospholipid synthase-like methyltransferase